MTSSEMAQAGETAAPTTMKRRGHFGDTSGTLRGHFGDIPEKYFPEKTSLKHDSSGTLRGHSPMGYRPHVAAYVPWSECHEPPCRSANAD